MFFGGKNNIEILKYNFKVMIDGISVLTCNDARNLEVTLGSNICFNEHIKTLLQKSYSSLRLIYGSHYILNKKFKTVLCELFVLSH